MGGYLITLLKFSTYAIIFVFGVLCLATGLYYLSQLVEEYERLVKKIFKIVIISVLVIHILLWLIEGYPLLYLLVGMLLHLFYLFLLPNFPRVQLTNPLFLASCVVLLLDHTVWFYYFTEEYHPFEDILTYYIFCVWMVPFFFFVGLTSNDDLLPYGAAINASGEPVGGTRKKNSLVVSLLEKLRGGIKKIFGAEKDSGKYF